MKKDYDSPQLVVFRLPIEYGFAISGESDGIEGTLWEDEETNPFA